MNRFKGLVSFAVITALFFVALRLVHLVVPIFYPRVLSGPFSLDDLGTVEQYTGFSPRVPFYRPEELGTRPVTITVTRRPHPKVTIFWQGEHFLVLTEQRGGEAPPRPVETWPLERHPEAAAWREGATTWVQLERDGLWIEVRTDLSTTDVERIVDSLRPYAELL